MTTEEKAKRYDEALERARVYWETDNDNTLDIKAKGTMECLFPELAESDEKMIDRVKESLNCFIDSLEENTDLEDDTRLSLIGNVKNEIKWVESLRDKTKWNPNTENNKPSVMHSVLMKTVDGVAEGERQGNYWYQYRWRSRIKDSDVLAWMELSDLKEINYDTRRKGKTL